MNLSKKYSISFGVTLAIFLLVLAWVTQTVMLQGFTNIEENLVKDDVNRVIKILEGELSNLDSTNVDWSTWDDTFGFVNGSIPDYPEINLQDSAIANIKVNMMLFLNSSGDVIYTKGVDLTEKTDMPVPAEMINAVRSNSRQAATTPRTARPLASCSYLKVLCWSHPGRFSKAAAKAPLAAPSY